MKIAFHKWQWAVISVVIIFFLGIIDWITGYHLNFFVFYFLPLFIAGWYLGTSSAVLLAILCSMIWFWADLLSGNTYPSSIYAVWNTMIRLIAFLAIGWLISFLRKIIDREKESAKKLRQSLSEIKVLESFLPICAQCKKIKNEKGAWEQLEVYIGEHANTQFSHTYCPDCYQKAMIELNKHKK